MHKANIRLHIFSKPGQKRRLIIGFWKKMEFWFLLLLRKRKEKKIFKSYYAVLYPYKENSPTDILVFLVPCK